MPQSLFHALGLMSGTSLDGIDAALIETDGYDFVKPLAFRFYAYEGDFRERIRACFGHTEGANDLHIATVERELTGLHASAVREFLNEPTTGAQGVDLIGFHGQTIVHRPGEGLTIQLGDGDYLARQTGIPVVNDFRSADVKAGGQGAPLVPLYHRALAGNLPKPVAIINIGGVANMTWIGDDEEILAFDMGPGNALIDDWMLLQTGRAFDRDGKTAALGTVDEARVERFLRDPFFRLKPPKSLDRDAFRSFMPEGMSAANGAATLTMMTVQAIVKGLQLIPEALNHPPLAGGSKALRAFGAGSQETPSPAKNKGLLKQAQVFASSPFRLRCCAASPSLEHSPAKPTGRRRARGEGLSSLPQIFLTGGGRHNTTMKRWIAEKSGLTVEPVEVLGWNGDSLEAEAFAYLAVRSKLGLALSLPGTTGVSRPVTGGTIHAVERRYPAKAI
jgi:anhydro-N-acetylmuramic acid kinase